MTTSLNPQIVGVTERALGALMDRVLGRTGGTFNQWLVLNLTTRSGGEIETARFVAAAVDARKVDPSEPLAAIAELVAEGLVEELPGERIRLTESGQARYAAIRATIDDITGRVWGGIPADDLAVAGRVMTTLTTNANAELATL